MWPLSPSSCDVVIIVVVVTNFVDGETILVVAGENMVKYTQKVMLAKKYMGLWIKGLTNIWIYGDDNIIYGYIIF